MRWARQAAVCLFLAWSCPAWPGTFPQFSLADTNGRLHAPAEFAAARAAGLLFVVTDCPLSKGYVPELNRIQHDYAARGVAFYAVQGDATVPEADVRRHVKEF